MLGSIGPKVSGKNPWNISLQGNANTNYGIIPIISYRKESFKNLTLNGIRDEEIQRSVRNEIQFSDFVLTANLLKKGLIENPEKRRDQPAQRLGLIDNRE